jgi:hypothetical protein
MSCEIIQQATIGTILIISNSVPPIFPLSTVNDSFFTAWHNKIKTRSSSAMAAKQQHGNYNLLTSRNTIVQTTISIDSQNTVGHVYLKHCGRSQ